MSTIPAPQFEVALDAPLTPLAEPLMMIPRRRAEALACARRGEIRWVL